jgi:EmrB/QacA subfamily drug resistance transporter
MPEISLDPRRWKALALLCVANFMVTLDSAIVILGLPSIQEDLNFSAGDEQWVVSAYLVSFGGLLLLGGRLADLLGRRRVFMVGTALFLISSLLCGLAWTAPILVIARVVQGLSAAIMAPTALSIVTTTFEEGNERNKALGFWTATAASGATAALLIGGPLTDLLGWEWIFFINVPVAFFLFFLSPVLLRESRVTAPNRSFDMIGAVTITAALVAGIYAVAEAPKTGWASGQTLGLLAAFVVLVALFCFIETRAAAPMVPLGIFRRRNLVGGNLMMAIAGMLAFGMPFALTAYGQQVLSYSPLRYGFATVTFTAMAVVGAFTGQGTVAKFGFQKLGAAAMILLGAGCLLLTQVSVNGTYFGDIFFGLLLFGPGLGLAVVGSTVAALSSVAEEEAGLASGINTSAFQIGGAVGVAIVSTIVVTYTSGSEPIAALTKGLQAGFATNVGFAALGLLVGLLILRMPKQQPAPAAAPAAESVGQ